jgi:hypothetical protein
VAEALRIRDVFRLSDGVTVLACERGRHLIDWPGRRVDLACQGEVRQAVMLRGERGLSGQLTRPGEMALETRDTVRLTSEEARSGDWRLLVSFDP